jgi:hypothetical protein
VKKTEFSSVATTTHEGLASEREVVRMLLCVALGGVEFSCSEKA